MLTPKIRKTNLVKDNTGFKVGGYARSRAFGTMHWCYPAKGI